MLQTIPFQLPGKSQLLNFDDITSSVATLSQLDLFDECPDYDLFQGIQSDFDKSHNSVERHCAKKERLQ